MPKPNTPQIRDTETLQLLQDNIGNLQHPLGWIKHPYFNDQFCTDRPGIREMRKRFCEAIVLLLETNDRLRKPPTLKPRLPRRKTNV